MARESTLKLNFYLQSNPGATLTPFVLDGAGIVKSPSAGDPTNIIYDLGSPPSPLPAVGDFVYITGTGWPSLDDRVHYVSAVDAVGGDFDITTDTNAESASLPVDLTDIDVTLPSWQECCLSEFGTNLGTPGEVDVTTMCDTERVTLPGLPTPGTATVTGMFDLDDDGMNAIRAAYDDGLARFLVGKTRQGQMMFFHGILSSFSPGALSVEGAITFTGSFTLDQSPYYAKAA